MTIRNSLNNRAIILMRSQLRRSLLVFPSRHSLTNRYELVQFMAILQLWQFRRLRNDSYPLPHTSKDVQRLAQLVFGMGSGHDGPQAGFAFRHSGIGNAWCEYAFPEELAAELHGQAAFANDDRRNGCFA